MHQQPRSGAAHLSLIEPDRIDQPFHGRIQIGVIEYDIGRFAAKFQSQGLARSGCGVANVAPHLCRSGKGNFINTRVSDDLFADTAIAGDNIHHAVRYCGLAADIGKKQSG